LPLLHNGKYRIQNSLDLIHDLSISEANDMVALIFEIGRSFGVITSCRFVCVLAAVELDNQTYLMTGEISKITPDRNLPPKMRPFDWNAPQMLPKLGFRSR